MADDLQRRVDEAFEGASRRHNIDERWLRSIAQTESGGDTQARSKAGAIGLMQMMPDTARHLAIDPHDPVQAIYGAAKLLDENLKRYGDPVKAMYAYNGGTDQSHWQNSETQAYPGKVMKSMAQIAAKQDARKPAPALDDSIYGWDAAPAQGQTSADSHTLGDDIYGWGPEEAKQPDKPQQSDLGKAWTLTNDTVNAAGREIDRTFGVGVPHLLSWAASAGHRYDNAASRALHDAGDYVARHEDADEDSRAGDYGSGVSDTVGTMAGALLTTELGGRVIRPAAAALETSRAGRIAANVLKGEGNRATKIANAALAAGVQTKLAGGDGVQAAELGGALAFGMPLLGEVASPLMRGSTNALKSGLARVGDYLDPAGAAQTAKMPSAVAGDMGAEMGGANVAAQKAEDKAQTKAIGKIGAFTDPKKAADAIMNAFSSSDGTRLYEAEVPGVFHTRATRTRDLKLAGLEKNMKQLYPEAFQALELANDHAYVSHLRDTIGTPEQIENLDNARKAFEAQHREAAFANESPVPTEALHQILDENIGAARGNLPVKSALAKAKDALSDAVDEDGTALPSRLWGVRQAIGYGLNQAAASESAHMRAAAARLSPFMDDLAHHIEAGAPGFRDYLEGYSRRSSEIDSMRFLQSRGLTSPSTDAPSGEIVHYQALKKLIGQMQNNEVAVARKGTDFILPEQKSRLDTLFRDMAAEKDLQTRIKTAGSDTFKNGMIQRTKQVRGGHVGGALSTAGTLAGEHMGGMLTGGLTGTAINAGNTLLGHALASRRLTNMERTDQEVINRLLGR